MKNYRGMHMEKNQLKGDLRKEVGLGFIHTHGMTSVWVYLDWVSSNITECFDIHWCLRMNDQNRYDVN